MVGVKYFNKVPKNCQWQKLKLHFILLGGFRPPNSTFPHLPGGMLCKMQKTHSQRHCLLHVGLARSRLVAYLFKQSTDRCWSLMPLSANQKHRTNSFDNATRSSWLFEYFEWETGSFLRLMSLRRRTPLLALMMLSKMHSRIKLMSLPPDNGNRMALGSTEPAVPNA